MLDLQAIDPTLKYKTFPLLLTHKEEDQYHN
jgi:hypothetical protein